MFRAPKNKAAMNWRPSASQEQLRFRAAIMQNIREFFAARQVMEVDTPVLCSTSVTDPYIESIPALFKAHPEQEALCYYLQTSPEYAMKRLLAAGSGAIYQITKAFRQGEIGRYHNPEFMMMEWYRPGFDHHDLMNEVDELLQLILKTPPAKRHTFAELFTTFLHLDVHQATVADLRTAAAVNNLHVHADIHDRDTWLNLLMSHCIEPHLGKHNPSFVYDFPASLASLARIRQGQPPLASRFEVYVRGVELANGFHELQCATEQRQRFEKNQAERQNLKLRPQAIDEFFLSALDHGLPHCAGVALGIDRLVMLAAHSETLAEAISFDFSRV